MSPEAVERPLIGRIVHYVSKLPPFVESPAIVSMTAADHITSTREAERLRFTEGEDITHRAHVAVWGAINDYREYDVPHDAEGAPGTWHWRHEPGRHA